MKQDQEEGIYFKGIKMFGENGSVLVNREWGKGGKWSKVFEIPEG